MPFVLEPMVAGELGGATEMDTSTHPPVVSRVQYVLDRPDPDDLIESFPVFLVADAVAAGLRDLALTGFELAEAEITTSAEYQAAFGGADHPNYQWLRVESDAANDCWLHDDLRLCVSDAMMLALRRHKLSDCLIEPLP